MLVVVLVLVDVEVVLVVVLVLVVGGSSAPLSDHVFMSVKVSVTPASRWPMYQPALPG